MAKLSISFGSVSVDYEGGNDFDLDAIKSLFDHLQPIANQTPPQVSTDQGTDVGESPRDTSAPLTMHINSIAARLNMRGAAGVVLAAAAHLQLVKGAEQFSRKELSDCMRTATGHFNKNMISNLGKTIQTLINQKKLNQIATDSYSLTAQEKESLKAALA